MTMYSLSGRDNPIAMLSFGWLGYLVYESRRIMMTVALLVHQEAYKTPARMLLLVSFVDDDLNIAYSW